MLKPASIFVPLLLLISQFQAAIASTPRNPLLTSDAIILSSQGIHKFDRTTLEPIWFSLPGVHAFDPVIGDSLIFVGSTQGLYALSPEDGTTVWHIESLQTIFSPAATDAFDTLFAGSLHGEIYAISPGDGAINWRQQLNGWIYSPVVLTDLEQLWTGGQAHEAIALDIKNGEVLNRLSLDQESIFSPQLLDQQQLIYNLFNGTSVVINASTATVVGQLKGPSQPRYFIYDMKNNEENFSGKFEGGWFSPIQIDDNQVVYFLKDYKQPNQIRAVKLKAGKT